MRVDVKKITLFLYILVGNNCVESATKFLQKARVYKTFAHVGHPVYHISQRSWWWSHKDDQPSQNKSAENKINIIFTTDPDIHTPIPLAKNGLQTIKGKHNQEIEEVVDFLKNREQYDRIGARVPTGLLMVGEPGVGKTAIARSIAEESGLPFHFACVSDFQGPHYGETQRAINKIFNDARADARGHDAQAAILFLDEVDALGSRTTMKENDLGNRQAITTILAQMNGVEQHKELLYTFAATNCAKSIDPALKRPGRFDRIIEIPLPDAQDRQAILRYYASNTRYHKKLVEFTQLAEMTQGHTPADLRYIVNEAALNAVRLQDDHITMKHYVNALASFEKRKQVTHLDSLTEALLKKGISSNFHHLAGGPILR